MSISATDPTWIAVQQWAKAQIGAAHVENEKQADDVTTAFTRGRIAMLRELIALPAGAKKPAIPTAPDYHL